VFFFLSGPSLAQILLDGALVVGQSVSDVSFPSCPASPPFFVRLLSVQLPPGAAIADSVFLGIHGLVLPHFFFLEVDFFVYRDTSGTTEGLFAGWLFF